MRHRGRSLSAANKMELAMTIRRAHGLCALATFELDQPSPDAVVTTRAYGCMSLRFGPWIRRS